VKKAAWSVLSQLPSSHVQSHIHGRRFSSRPLAWLVKFLLKSVCYAPFLQQSVKQQIVLFVMSLCSLPSTVCEVKVCLLFLILCY